MVVGAIEHAEAGLVTASGMAAISTSLLTILKCGDHLLAQNCLYGGTHDFVTRDLQRCGIEYSFIDADDSDSWSTQLRPNTKAIYCETITNPLIQVADLQGIARFAKDNGLVSLIDNTFASPVNFNPIDHGFDLVLHSGTKYLNGHTDIVAGAVVGSTELVEQVRHKFNHMGGALDPHACFLLHRGMKTLVLRVKAQCENAMQIARFLEGHDADARVDYPGLESHPQHARARALFAGFGGMLSFELKGGAEAADRLVKRVALPIHAASLGGVESLIIIPAKSSHLGRTSEDRARVGISDGLVRFSTGIESADDLLDDLRQALEV
jgi:cystathionine beta-lyase/cystathionine gamma-synthase